MAGAGLSNFNMAQDSSNDGESFTDAFEIVENTWLDDESLQRGEVEFLHSDETKFWNGILDKYLHPIDDEKDKVKLPRRLYRCNRKKYILICFFFLIFSRELSEISRIFETKLYLLSL